MMEETLLLFVFSFSSSFTDRIGARDLNCLSSCLVGRNISVLQLAFPLQQTPEICCSRPSFGSHLNQSSSTDSLSKRLRQLCRLGTISETRSVTKIFYLLKILPLLLVAFTAYLQIKEFSSINEGFPLQLQFLTGVIQ